MQVCLIAHNICPTFQQPFLRLYFHHVGCIIILLIAVVTWPHHFLSAILEGEFAIVTQTFHAIHPSFLPFWSDESALALSIYPDTSIATVPVPLPSQHLTTQKHLMRWKTPQFHSLSLHIPSNGITHAWRGTGGKNALLDPWNRNLLWNNLMAYTEWRLPDSDWKLLWIKH